MQKRQYIITFTFLFMLTLLPCSAISETALTIFYAGEEQGELGLHGCGSKQVGGLAHRLPLFENLYIRHPGAVLNLHMGNLVDATDENAARVYQIGLSALEAMQVDVLCLGPNELSLPLETLTSLHATHSDINVTCANVKQITKKRYVIQTVASVNVAVVNLISETHAQTLSNNSLIPPQTALSELTSELIDNSDLVVVVVHCRLEEAFSLAKTFPWINVLIVADNQQRDTYGIHNPSIFTSQNAIVTNVSQGAAVGVLEVGYDSELNRHIFTNAYHGVSEDIAPNAALAQLLRLMR